MGKLDVRMANARRRRGEIIRAVEREGSQTAVAKRLGISRQAVSMAICQRRASGLCADCGAAPAQHLHHITPRKEGGSNAWSNIAQLCPRCHRRRHTPESARGRTLVFIGHYMQEKGFAPSLRDVADALGVSLSTAHRSVSELARRRLLRKPPARSCRAMMVTDDGREAIRLTEGATEHGRE